MPPPRCSPPRCRIAACAAAMWHLAHLIPHLSGILLTSSAIRACVSYADTVKESRMCCTVRSCE
eukprot:scaffold173872_cov18-Tisochrysis_lutea.AAC.2